MVQEQLQSLAQKRFTPGAQVLILGQPGWDARYATVQGVVSGIFNHARGLGLMVWPVDSFLPTAYELSWAVEHVQVVCRQL